MASRNLTPKFVNIRNATKGSRKSRISEEPGSPDSQLLEGGGYKNAKLSLPPIWVDKMDQVEADISKIQNKMKELNELHTKRLKVNFDADESAQEREIDIVTQEITDLFHHCEVLLKQFAKLGDESKISQAEMVVRKNMQHSIAKKLQGLSASFRSNQKKYLNTLQQQKDPQMKPLYDLDREKKMSTFFEQDSGFNAAQLQVIEDTEALVNQRDEEITKIAKSIEELAQIFKELAAMVIDQGTILDRIDYNMEQVLSHTKEGIEQLTKAEDHQKSAMSVRCIILLVVLIIIMLIALVLKNTASKKQ